MSRSSQQAAPSLLKLRENHPSIRERQNILPYQTRLHHPIISLAQCDSIPPPFCVPWLQVFFLLLRHSGVRVTRFVSVKQLFQRQFLLHECSEIFVAGRVPRSLRTNSKRETDTNCTKQMLMARPTTTAKLFFVFFFPLQNLKFATLLAKVKRLLRSGINNDCNFVGDEETWIEQSRLSDDLGRKYSNRVS